MLHTDLIQKPKVNVLTNWLQGGTGITSANMQKCLDEFPGAARDLLHVPLLEKDFISAMTELFGEGNSEGKQPGRANGV